MDTNEEEVRALIQEQQAKEKEKLRQQFRRVFDHIVVPEDPQKRVKTAERLSDTFARMTLSSRESSKQDAMIPGFLSKAGFYAKLETYLEIIKNSGSNLPTTILMMDMDFFKKLNDTLGHFKGDDAIKVAGRCVFESIRGIDLPGHFGGDEIIIALPGANLDGCTKVALRIKTNVPKAIAEVFSEYDQRQTASIAMAEILPGEDPQVAFGRADSGLYYAKSIRDCVVKTTENSYGELVHEVVNENTEQPKVT